MTEEETLRAEEENIRQFLGVSSSNPQTTSELTNEEENVRQFLDMPSSDEQTAPLENYSSEELQTRQFLGLETAIGPLNLQAPYEDKGGIAEFITGFRGAVADFIFGAPERFGFGLDTGKLNRNKNNLDAFEKFDTGVDVETIRQEAKDKSTDSFGGNMLPEDIKLYARSTPEKRAEMKEKAVRLIQESEQDIQKTLPLMAQHDVAMQKYAPNIKALGEIDSLDKFEEYLGYHVAAGAVHLIPQLILARFGGALPTVSYSTALAYDESMSNRLDYITDFTKNIQDPAKQAEAIALYLQETGDVTLLQALVSGTLDVVGPTQRALRQFLQRESSDLIQTAAQKKVKNEANESLLEKATKDFYGEGLTGGAQEAVQIIGQDYLGETQDLTTDKVVSRILNASAAEAFGGLGGTTVAQFTEIANKQLDAQSQRIAADHIKSEIENSPLTPKQKVEFEQKIDELMSEINPVTGRVYTEAEATIRAAQLGAAEAINTSDIPPEEKQSETLGDAPDPVQQVVEELRDSNKDASDTLTEISQPQKDPKLVGEEVPTGEEDNVIDPNVLDPNILGVDSNGAPVFTLDQVAQAQTKIPDTPTINIESIRETYKESVAEEIVEVSKKIIEEGNLAGVSIPVGDALARAETEVTEGRDTTEVLKAAEIQPADVAPTDTTPTDVASTDTAPTDVASTDAAPTLNLFKDARDKIANQEVTTPKVKLPKKKKANGLQPAGKQTTKVKEQLTPEEQQEKETYRRKRAEINRDATRTAKKALDVVSKEIDTENFLSNYINLETAREAAEDIIQNRINQLATAYEVLANTDIGPKVKAKQLAQAAIDHPSVTRDEKESAKFRAKRRIKETKTNDAKQKQPLSTQTSNQANSDYIRYGASVRALDAIINNKEGSMFERALAKRLKPFLTNVQVVVIDNEAQINNEIARLQFSDSLGMYTETTNGERIIYLNRDGGINNTVFLHEAVHAATARQVDKYLAEPDSVDTSTRAAIEDLKTLMYDAYKQYALKKAAGKTSAELDALYDLDAFTDVKEFLSYGLTQPEMQEFLSTVPGAFKPGSKQLEFNSFSQFLKSVSNIIKLSFGKLGGFESSFGQLVTVTDRLLEIQSESAFFNKPTADVIAQAKRAEALNNKAANKVARSRQADDAGAMFNLSRSEKIASSWAGTGEALRTSTLRKILFTMPTNAVIDMGERFHQLKSLRRMATLVNKIAASRMGRMRVLAKESDRWAKFFRADQENANALADLMHFASLEGFDPAKHADLSAALANDETLKELKQDRDDALKDPSMSAQQIGARRGLVTKRENLIKALYKGGEITLANGQTYKVKGWSSLPTEAHSIYKMARDRYRKNFENHYELLVKNIKKSSFVPGELEDVDSPKAKVLAEIEKNFLEVGALDVYFPLMRYGQHWLRVGKSKDSEFYMFESASERNTFAINRAKELIANGDARTVEEIRSEFMKQGDTIESARADDLENVALLKTVFESIDENATVDPVTGRRSMSDQSISQLKDQVYQMYLMTLPDKSLKKRYSHRTGRGGFSSDALRNFVSTNHTAANQLSRLEYNNDLRLSVGAAYAELDGMPFTKKTAAEAYVKEIAERSLGQIQPIFTDPQGLAGKVDTLIRFGNQASFFYFLTSPKSAFVQLTQFPLIGIPVLIARHGLARTTAVISKYAALGTMGIGTTVTDEFTGNKELKMFQFIEGDWIENNVSPELIPAFRRAVEIAKERDVFNSTFVSEVSDRERISSSEYSNNTKQRLKDGIKMMGTLFHNAERVTREMTFLSSFELELKKRLDSGVPLEKAIDAAAFEAVDTTYETLFDYGNYNKSRLQQLRGMKLPMQFMTFPINMVAYLIRNAANIMAPMNPGDRKAAATKLFGTLGMAFTFAGTTGLPMYSVVMGAAEAIRDTLGGEELEEDDPSNPLTRRNLDLWYREEFLPNEFGAGSSIAAALGLSKEQGVMLQRAIELGPISALTDFNIGASVSLDNLFFRDTANPLTAEGQMDMAMALTLGPFGSLLTNLTNSIKDFEEGRWEKGFEKLSPAAIRGLFKTYRYTEEGEETPKGAEMREESWFTTSKLVASGLGFSSTELAEIKERNSLITQEQYKVVDERQGLINKFKRIVKDTRKKPSLKNDNNLKNVIEEISVFNSANGMQAITGNTLRNSILKTEEALFKAPDGLMLRQEFYMSVVPYLQPTRAKVFKD